MDTVYSTKKYFQNLGSDYYRSPSASRQMGTDYTSYRGGDTVGRRSTLGPSYTHMHSNKYSYATDQSIYGGASQYNGGWGLWRDTGNLSPTTMSSTKKRSIKSFSIILMTAAFIVVLAVLSVAGLAFYFSTFRNDMDNSALAFDGQFHVLRGDVFTTGLKYNHTSAFRQKRDYYAKLIETALQEKGGMSVTKCEIDSFGSGPLIQVKFRVLLDMKSMPMTMTNVEEHIKQSLLQEVTSPVSPFKSIKIDQETMDVKRLLDHDMLKTASFMREIDLQNQPDEPSLLMTSPKSSAYDEKVSKKPGVIEKTIHKFSATTAQMGNTPSPPRGSPGGVTQSGVIKGSFEITKTEADIAQKKDTPPAQFQTTPGGGGGKATTAKVKNNSGKFGAVPSAGSSVRPNLGKIDKIEKVNPTSSSTTTTTTTEAAAMTSTPISSVPIATDLSTISTSLSPPQNENNKNGAGEAGLGNMHKYPDNENLPQLDVNLFTSAPILDSQPWHPIPVPVVPATAQAAPDQRKPDQRKGHPATVATPNNSHKFAENQQKPTPPQLQATGQAGGVLVGQQQPAMSSGVGDMEPNRKKLVESVTKAPSRPIYYQSYTNPTFSLTTLGIERLGASDVRPYPLPVNKLYDEEGQTSPLDTGMHLHEGEIMNGNGQAPMDELVGYDERFEHLGGGVSAKKPDLLDDKKITEKSASVEATTSSSSLPPPPLAVNSDQSEQLGDILLDLLDLKDQEQELQQRNKYIPEGEEEVTAEVDVMPDGGEEKLELEEEHLEATTKLNFINIREHILNKNKVPSAAAMETTTAASSAPAEQTLVSTSASGPQSQGSKLNTPEPPTVMMTNSKLTGGADKTPILDDSSAAPGSDNNNNDTWSGPVLFPLHTTWELVNGTTTGEHQKPDQSHLRRVYNDTLQAWIVENAEAKDYNSYGNKQELDTHSATSPGASTTSLSSSSSSSSSSKKQEGTIQNISVIFDTLASKLGITPDVSSKSPPFQNKVRNRTPQPSAVSPTNPTTASPYIVKTRILTTPKSSAAPTTTTIQPEIIATAAGDDFEAGEYEYEDEVEGEENLTSSTTTTTTTSTTTKKPRRKTTTRKTSTTSKPKIRSTPQPSVAGGKGATTETRPSIRVVETTSKLPSPPPVTTTRPPTRTDQSIVSRPVTAQTTTRRPSTTTTTTEPTTTAAAVTESVIPPIFQLDPDGDDNVMPIIISDPADASYEMSSEAISFGKAEVEVVVDPDTVYADLLRKQITTRAPPLVTLLPVRSNSGIRTFRTPMQQRRAGEIETRRAFAKLPAVPPPATIVRTSMRVGNN